MKFIGIFISNTFSNCQEFSSFFSWIYVSLYFGHLIFYMHFLPTCPLFFLSTFILFFLVCLRSCLFSCICIGSFATSLIFFLWTLTEKIETIICLSWGNMGIISSYKALFLFHICEYFPPIPFLILTLFPLP